MIELKVKDLTFGGTFYFHTIQDCDDFYVFLKTIGAMFRGKNQEKFLMISQ